MRLTIDSEARKGLEEREVDVDMVVKFLIKSEEVEAAQSVKGRIADQSPKDAASVSPKNRGGRKSAAP